MEKTKALEKLHILFENIKKLKIIGYNEDNSELEKFRRRGIRYIKEIFKNSTRYVAIFEGISYSDSAAVINSIFDKSSSDTSTIIHKQAYQKGLNKARGLIESFVEEVEDWKESKEEKIIDELNTQLNVITILEETEFKRYKTNVLLERFKHNTQNILRKIGLETKFKSISFLYMGPRGMHGIQVPADLDQYKDALVKSKILLSLAINDIKEGHIMIEKQEQETPKEVKIKKENKSKVFIVHGHDNGAKQEVARFIEKLGFEPIILHEQDSGQKTIIEKIEEYAGQAGFGIVLYTPCDVGGKDETTLQARARQNVVFEHGYLIGLLGRGNVCPLVKGNIEKPGDIGGVVYTPMDENGSWHLPLAKELKRAGYIVDPSKLF